MDDTEIFQKILDPIDHYLEGVYNEKQLCSYGVFYSAEEARNHGKYKFLQERLNPIYLKLLRADEGFFHNGNSDTQARRLILSILEGEGERYCHVFNNVNIIECAENWGKNSDTKHRNIFCEILLTLFTHGYSPDLNKLYTELCDKIRISKHKKQYAIDEMYCLLMGFTMIARTCLDYNEKVELYKQLVYNWKFMCYIYSVMLEHIIAFKTTDFAALANFMSLRKADSCFMHLFYRAFYMKFNRLCPPGVLDNDGREVRQSASRNLQRISELIESTERDDSLNQLCCILFPKNFDEVLSQNCPKSYDELANENKQLIDKCSKLQEHCKEVEAKPTVIVEENYGTINGDIQDLNVGNVSPTE